MLRNPWFWITIAIIALGVALTAALGVFYWLVGALIVAVVLLVVAFLVAAYAVGRAEPPPILASPEIPPSARIPVIYDCDGAMGHPFQDVGGGLALLYLLGEPRVHLRLVTTVYGSGSVGMATRVARRLLERVGVKDTPVVAGASAPSGDAATNRAAQAMREMVDRSPGEVAIIAVGAMTNLKHAAALDPGFFGKLRGLYLLGGVTETLVWNKHRLGERNFSLDPEAAYQALHADCPVTVVVGEAGLSAVFRARQFAALKAAGPVCALIARQARGWFALMRLWFQDGGFGMWDPIAAVAVAHPELLESEQAHIASTRDDLRSGQLFTTAGRGGPVRLVRRVRDFDRFIALLFAAWRRI